ncbi:MAG: hypothetical protein CMQ54_04530 [Gammaproteobacteria bacterium]|nr:hypothetical protein [Gammaproteobacteria bacterium]|tara:strand:+ start:18524 stop:18835 length:312 start_codon:yes stop_codon:yes gene_type:complete
MSINKLKNILNSGDQQELGSLIKHTQRMTELTDHLCRTLPKTDRHAIVAANVRDNGELVVICTSSAWASRLRYKTKILIEAANEAGIKANSCRIRISGSGVNY